MQGGRADFEKNMKQEVDDARVEQTKVKRQAKRDSKAKRQAKRQAKRDAKAKQQAERDAEAKRQEEREREVKQKAEHDARVQHARNTVWYAADWEWKARKELNAVQKLWSWERSEGDLERARRDYYEAYTKHAVITALLGELYPKFRLVSPEEYAAYRDGRDIKRGRALMKSHFQCTPSRDTVLKNQQ